MRVFVAGGTGVIGRRAVARLIEAGHDVTALSRRVESDESLRAASATPVRVDLFDSNGLESVLSGHDAVVNVATAIPSLAQAIKPSSWETNNRIRREGAATLAAAAAAAGVTRYVQESVSFDYRDGGDSWVCEDHPRDLELAGPGESAERAAREFPGDGIILRFAQFVSPDSGQSVALLAIGAGTCRRCWGRVRATQASFTPMTQLPPWSLRSKPRPAPTTLPKRNQHGDKTSIALSLRRSGNVSRFGFPLLSFDEWTPTPTRSCVHTGLTATGSVS